MTQNNLQDENKTEYLWALEKQWRESQSQLTDAELLDAFPDGIAQLSDKVLELKADADNSIQNIRDIISPYVGRTDHDAIIAQEFTKQWCIPDLLKIEAAIQRIERLQHKQKYGQQSFGLKDKDIDVARSTPIHGIAEQYVSKLQRRGSNYIGCCPFHSDSTPSLVLYTDTNSYYCFGCQAGGDVITFTKKVLGADFKSTIHYLTS